MADYDVNIPRLILTCLLGAILTAVVVVGLQVLYYGYVAGLERSEEPGGPPRELEALLDGQKTRLAEYRVVDREKGIVAIPISRAMELVVSELSAPDPGDSPDQDSSREDDHET